MQAGVNKILGDLFLHGSLTGLQVAGSPEEYFVRVGVQLDGKMFKHSFQVVVFLGGGNLSVVATVWGQGAADMQTRLFRVPEPPPLAHMFPRGPFLIYQVARVHRFDGGPNLRIPLCQWQPHSMRERASRASGC